MRGDEVELAIELAAGEGWNPGLHDARCFFEADPKGFLIAEIDGGLAGCLAAVSYDEHFGFIGLYIVVPQWRSQSIGWRSASQASSCSDPRTLADMPLSKLVTGGQSGVDRGALDAALAAGFSCGGWCPPGRAAEDGPIPERYPVTEMPGGSYRERTKRNVIESDATLVIYFEQLHGGTEQTVLDCIELEKPYKLIDAVEIAPARAAELAAQFIARHGVSVLNVAGPRASHAPEAHRYTTEAIARLLRS